MQLQTNEKIKVILGRRDMTISELAAALSTSRQNLTNKLSRNNFSESELKNIAQALNCTFEVSFVLNDTGESI